MKKISRVSTIISAIMLLIYIIVLISIWSRIPDIVPTHFNAAGVADSYGSKRNLVFEPVLVSVSVVVPHINGKNSGNLEFSGGCYRREQRKIV